MNISIKCKDSRSLSAIHLVKEDSKRIVIINSALGVKKEFYLEFAKYLSVSKNVSVLIWDPRGVGGSKYTHPRKDEARLRDWGIIDFDSVLNFAFTDLNYKWSDIHVIGHSAGGHLMGLADSFKNLNSITLIASGVSSVNSYSLSTQIKMYLQWYFLVPLVLKKYKYAPGKFGIGEDLPKGVMLDWKKWSLSRQYLFDDEELDVSNYYNFKGKIQALGFLDDTSFAPQKAIEKLLSYFPSSEKRMSILSPSEFDKKKIGHFSFFKSSDLWLPVLDKITI